MLYPQNLNETLKEEVFRNPGSEYRGAPFWAWNCKLEAEELTRQLDVLKEMGFGGAHLHTRTGLDTPYLSDEFMEMVKKGTPAEEALEKAKGCYGRFKEAAKYIDPRQE